MAEANEPMSDERLAEIRAWDAERNRRTVRDRPNSAVAHRHELLAEVERLRGERKADDERIEYATDLLIALARTSPCLQEKGGCITHDRYLPEGSDCPHGLARAFVAGTGAWSKS